MNKGNGMDSKQAEIHQQAMAIVHAEAGRTLSRDDFDLCMRIAKSALASLQPAQEPVAWMRHDKTMCLTDDSKRQMEATAFGHWKEVAASYTIPLTFANAPLPQSALSTDAQKVRNEALEIPHIADSLIESIADRYGELNDAAEFLRNGWGCAGVEDVKAALIELRTIMQNNIDEAIRALQSQPAGKDAEDAENPDELEPPELLASRLITAWCNAHGKQIPWAKAIEITAIVTKMPEEEKRRLLALDDDAEIEGEKP